MKKLILSIAIVGFATGISLAQTTASSTSLTKHQSSYKISLSDYQQHLQKVITDKITAAGYHFNNDVRQTLNSFVNDGAKKMFNGGQPNDDQKKAAEAYVAKFGDAVVADAKSRKLEGKLDMMSFRSARSILCPNPIFCKQ
ncbi:hypothetical protein [Taibaiella soli]|uniref:Uncharacterized protein n=1 Tax=Taibaiella soli TaxID=1649169 RepID=A0A2W2BV59_9BACT|nr:hypothetical protein [Taibaiella soli]PZF71693.1 hypothetical protein DN068_16625 [Taibaiella soli]